MQLALLSSISLVLAVAPTLAQQSGEKTRVLLGTATPGGGFPAYGAAFAAGLSVRMRGRHSGARRRRNQ